MTEMTVAGFAQELKMPVELLIEQFNSAGVKKTSATDEVTEADKALLLASLQRAHGSADGAKKKISITKKQTSEIRQADATGKTRTVQVEVKKKRTFVARDALAEVAAAAEPAAEQKPAVAVIDEAEIAKREAELARAKELLARQEADAKARAQAEQEATAVESPEAPVVEAAAETAPAEVTSIEAASVDTAPAPVAPAKPAVQPAAAAVDANKADDAESNAEKRLDKD